MLSSVGGRIAFARGSPDPSGFGVSVVTARFVYVRPVTVVHVREQGPYAAASERAWERIFGWLHATGTLESSGRGYGLMHDNPHAVGAENCRYDACIELPDTIAEVDLPTGFALQTLAGGAYGCKRHVGGVAGLRDAIAHLRDEWVPRQGLLVDPSRPLIEVFHDDPATTAEHKREVDIFLPVMTEAERGERA